MNRGGHAVCDVCGDTGILRSPRNDGDDSNDREEVCPDCALDDAETLPFERDDDARLAEADAIDRRILARDLADAFDFGGES